MKRKSSKPLIIFILLLIGIIIFLLQFNITPKKINSPYTADNPTQNQIENTKEEPKQNILDIQKQVEEQLRKEQAIKAEQERLTRLQNPELITSNLREVGILITFTGEKTYKDKIIQKGFLNARGLLVNLVYEFGIGMDLNKIYVEKIVGDKVTINIPKVALQVEYIKRLNKDSLISGTKSLFAKQFKPSEIDFIYEQSQEMVLTEVNGTPEYFDKAYESLKDNLESLIKELGYKQVIFKQI
jgi:hypothetical protein